MNWKKAFECILHKQHDNESETNASHMAVELDTVRFRCVAHSSWRRRPTMPLVFVRIWSVRANKMKRIVN